MKTNDLKLVFYTDVKRIDDAKYYFMRIVNVSIPTEISDKLEIAAKLLSEAKQQSIEFFNQRNYETETK